MTPSLVWDTDGANWPNRRFSRFVDAGACRWHIQRAGAGPRVLLIHGTGASTHSWAGLFPLLAARCDVLAADLPGHAFTRATEAAETSLPGMAAGLSQLIGQTGFQPDILIGHSAGAAIAIRLAANLAQPPAYVIGLNAALRPLGGMAGLAGPFIARAMTVSPLMARLIARRACDRDRIARLIRSTGSTPSEPYLGIYAKLFANPAHVRGTLRMMAGWDVSDIDRDIRRAPYPLALMTGDLDQAVSPAEAAEFASRYKGVHHLPLTGLGHLAHEEDPERIFEALLALIGDRQFEGKRARA
ncbi:MAG: alpha/beta hydrolase [Hyphomonas sp.]|uniref:alpha/beta fold hydrolase BchO n=1 Tax=Hyphomonas sp. TaxID=87 RepID=UPI001D5EEA87|nr:alpha/beta fold hydrolase BchO [Hyphomonas sp.]MBA4225971.1 alpha/beta hydrolase [Hyphomonas sp.]